MTDVVRGVKYNRGGWAAVAAVGFLALVGYIITLGTLGYLEDPLGLWVMPSILGGMVLVGVAIHKWRPAIIGQFGNPEEGTTR